MSRYNTSGIGFSLCWYTSRQLIQESTTTDCRKLYMNHFPKILFRLHISRLIVWPRTAASIKWWVWVVRKLWVLNMSPHWRRRVCSSSMRWTMNGRYIYFPSILMAFVQWDLHSMIPTRVSFRGGAILAQPPYGCIPISLSIIRTKFARLSYTM